MPALAARTVGWIHAQNRDQAKPAAVEPGREGGADPFPRRLAGAGCTKCLFLFETMLALCFWRVAAFALFVAQLGAFTTPIRLVIAPAAVIAGAYAPEIFISNAATKRKKELPRACRMHSICW